MASSESTTPTAWPSGSGASYAWAPIPAAPIMALRLPSQGGAGAGFNGAQQRRGVVSWLDLRPATIDDVIFSPARALDLLRCFATLDSLSPLRPCCLSPPRLICSGVEGEQWGQQRRSGQRAGNGGGEQGRRHGGGQLQRGSRPLHTMDINASPLSVSQPPARDWSELPLDSLSKIFMKLGPIEILMGAGLVCHSWLAAAKTPELWRFVDMTSHKVIFAKDIPTVCAMAKVAVDRSAGQMESFWAQNFVTTDLLDYMASRVNSLKSIRLVACGYVRETSLLNLANKCPLLEELECSYYPMPAEFFRCIGQVRPELKRLRIYIEEWYDSDQMRREIEEEYRQSCGYEEETDEDEESEDWEARQNEDAFAIAESLHELRVLHIAGNSLTNKGLYAILDSCPHLECLDISECSHVRVNNELQARCAKLKHFVRSPRQRHNVHCPDLHIIRKEEDEDYFDYISEDLDLRGESEMDDDYGSYGNYWQDYSPPSSPDDTPTDIHEYYSQL
ncbi:hypothetical protein PR202_gb28591 [Eleusine coracana subsp. coracana]|uniref:F-box domain-containing protein n=1 Tax=Eleusine coracana subsp. coracana TaxID=191504 RepID=A0AAV5FXP3_ELECO|nr:hypothetical protein PR202_gb28591 [Eleusine coracana subsp. coracana]